MNQLVSIIVPVYNIEDYLPACIESILLQEHRAFELILVNDGSEDNSGQICDNFAEEDSRIRVIHQTNQGVSAARNSGIKNAKGDYITFIDGDDLIHRKYLSEMHACILNNPQSDIVVCEKQAFVTDFNTQATQQIEKVQVWSSVEALDQLLYQRIINAPFAKLFKENLLKDDSFPVGVRIGEDLLMNITAFSRAHHVSQILKPLYGYRNRPGSAISTSHIPDRMLLISELLKVLNERPVSDTLNASLQARIFAEAVYGSLSLKGKISRQHAADWNSLKEILISYKKNVLLDSQARPFLRVFALACYISPQLPGTILECWQKIASKKKK